MKNNPIIFHELKDISPLIAEIDKINPYSIPLSYFNNLPLLLTEKVNLLQEASRGLTTSMPFDVPTNYFDNLAADLCKKANLQAMANEVFEETELIAPLLNTISKRSVYHVPEHFFSKNALQHNAIKRQPAKVVSVNRAKVLRFSAAAAAVVLFCTAGLYTITKKSDVALSAPRAGDRVKNLSKEEIVHYLKSDISNQNLTSASKPKLKSEAAIKSSLKEVSDKEIQQFLKETGGLDEI